MTEWTPQTQSDRYALREGGAFLAGVKYEGGHWWKAETEGGQSKRFYGRNSGAKAAREWAETAAHSEQLGLKWQVGGEELRLMCRGELLAVVKQVKGKTPRKPSAAPLTDFDLDNRKPARPVRWDKVRIEATLPPTEPRRRKIFTGGYKRQMKAAREWAENAALEYLTGKPRRKKTRQKARAPQKPLSRPAGKDIAEIWF